MMYQFSGLVTDVLKEDGEAILQMRDLTDTSLPEEEWIVALDKLPPALHAGEYLIFTIHDDWASTFSIDRKQWTHVELAEARLAGRRRAERIMRILDVD